MSKNDKEMEKVGWTINVNSIKWLNNLKENHRFLLLIVMD